MKNRGKKMVNRLMAVLSISFAVLLLQILIADKAYAKNDDITESLIDEQMNTGQMNGLGDQLKKYSSTEMEELISGYDPKKIIKNIAEGKFEYNAAGIFKKVMIFLFKEIYLNTHVLIRVIILVILCALLKNLQTSFLSESIGELAFYTCYVVIVSVLLVSLNTAIGMAREIIEGMVSFMYATIPVLVTLLVSGGNLTSAGIFQPLLVMIVEVSATVMKNVFIPLVLLSAVLSLINNISDKVQISKLANFINQITGWAMGTMLTIFIAFVTVQGSIGAVTDGIAGKTAKFAIATFIPVAGKILSDAADTVVGCSLMIKNAAGIAVMIAISAMCIIPILKIFALVALYKMCCALVEPISESRITGSINSIANSMTYIIGIVASVAFMFLISITVIISASNISAMIR